MLALDFGLAFVQIFSVDICFLMLDQMPRQEWEQGVLRNSNLAAAAPGTLEDVL